MRARHASNPAALQQQIIDKLQQVIEDTVLENVHLKDIIDVMGTQVQAALEGPAV